MLNQKKILINKSSHMKEYYSFAKYSIVKRTFNDMGINSHCIKWKNPPV